MAKLSQERMRLLVKVCHLYYIDGLSQQEIAKKIFLSGSQVSRMLAYAREHEIVKITIDDPFSEDQKYESWISRHFGIKDAIVVDVPDGSLPQNDLSMLNSATRVLESSIKKDSVIGVMAGTSVSAVCSGVRPSVHRGISVVPLVGGVGTEGYWQANLNAKYLSENLGCKSLQLNAPVILGTDSMRNALIKEPEISSVLELGRKSDVALIGLGRISNGATIMEPGFLKKNELAELQEKGAVTSICNTFLDRDGNLIDFKPYSRMIGLTADEIKAIPMVIAVAYGEEKATSIAAALKGQWIDILLTTLSTAKALCKLCDAEDEL